MASALRTRLQDLFPPPRSIAWCSLAVLVTFAPFVLHWGQIGAGDFDQFATFNQIAVWWHQLGDRTVTWNPFLCGGASLVGNPQISLLHPYTLFYSLLGPVSGIGVSLIPAVVLGFVGMRGLCVDHGLRPSISDAVATTWAVNGFALAHFGQMHASFAGFWGLPLLAFLHRRIVGGHRLSWIIYPFLIAHFGLYSPQFVAYGMPFVVLHFGLEWVLGPGRPQWRTALKYSLALSLGVGMLCVFLLPAMAWARDFPRLKGTETVNPLDLLQMVLSPIQLYPFERPYRAHEYMMTLGPVWLGAALLGYRQGAATRTLPLTLVGVGGFLTAVGSFAGFGLPAVGPYDLLKGLVPGYGAVRLPSRFFVHALPALLVAGGLGAQWWLDRGRSPAVVRGAMAAAVVPMLGLALFFYGAKLYRSIEGQERIQPARMTATFEWAPEGHRRQMFSALTPSTGVLDCYDALEIPVARGLDRNRGVVLASELDVAVERISWGEIVLRVTSEPVGGAIQLNFNHHSGWRVIDGQAEIRSELREPLRVEVAAGETIFRIRHFDRSWEYGWKIAALSLGIAIMVVLVVLIRARREAEE